jgi:hypothetical protein
MAPEQTGRMNRSVAPLGLDDLGRLVADALRCGAERARPLAQLVQEKTGGNAFFAIQFLIALAEEGLLSFNPAIPAWQWDIGRIHARNYTDNVVDLMTGKLQRLPAGTREAVQASPAWAMPPRRRCSLWHRAQPRRRCTPPWRMPYRRSLYSGSMAPTVFRTTGSSRRRMR